MAATIQVAGPTVIKWGAAAASNILGYSDNDTLPAISFSDFQHEVKTVSSGAVPEEIILQGTMARISVALVKWDESELTALLLRQRGTAANETAVGRRIVADSGSFFLSVESVGNTQKYLFERAYLVSDGVNDSQWGNRERVLTLNFHAIPKSDGTLYTYTAQT